MDAKNRIRIPAKFSDKLGETFYVARGSENNLYCFNEETFEKYSKVFDDAPVYEEDKKLALFRHFFNSIEEVSKDAHGRVLLPSELVKYAGLKKDIVISGSGDRLEIWDAQVYDESVGSKPFGEVLDNAKD